MHTRHAAFLSSSSSKVAVVREKTTPYTRVGSHTKTKEYFTHTKVQDQPDAHIHQLSPRTGLAHHARRTTQTARPTAGTRNAILDRACSRVFHERRPCFFVACVVSSQARPFFACVPVPVR